MRRTGIFLIVVLISIAAASAELDKSPPRSYIESMYGWYDRGVNVKLAAQDDLSGIISVSYMIDGTLLDVSYSPETDIRFDTEGVHRIEYFAMDCAGNAEQAKTSLVKLDFTAPVIDVPAHGSGTYLHSDIIRLDYSARDPLSGIFSLTASINGTPVTASQEFDMLNLRPGNYEFNIAAQDNAGNVGTSSINFTVAANIYSLMDLNDRAVVNKWIIHKGTAESLTRMLAIAEQEFEAGQNEKANDIIKSYVNEIERQRERTITGYGADLLITEASYAYISLV